jgi:hypothetical protein
LDQGFLEHYSRGNAMSLCERQSFDEDKNDSKVRRKVDGAAIEIVKHEVDTEGNNEIGAAVYFGFMMEKPVPSDRYSQRADCNHNNVEEIRINVKNILDILGPDLTEDDEN